MFTNGIDDQKLSKLLCFLIFSIILRFNSIIIFPIILVFVFLNFKALYKYFYFHKLYTSFLLLGFMLFLLKNLLVSGCLIYPVYQTCFNKLDWSPNYEVTKLKYQKLQSDSKGWPFYAKENFQIKEKFVWDNLEKNGFKSFDKYSKAYPWFWVKYWAKDHNYKKIVNLFLISIIISLSIVLFNTRNTKILKLNKLDYFFLISIIFSCFFWFNISPQTRYGGYFVFLILFGFINYLFIFKFF